MTCRTIIAILVLSGVLSLPSGPVGAKVTAPITTKFRAPDLKIIPVQRLIANLSAQAKAKPNDFALRVNLARAHAMAWATKGADVQVDGDRLWFGFTPKFIPFGVVGTVDKEKQAAAQKNLETAIAQYRKAIELEPNSPVTLLGLAWVLDQAGEDEEARTLYRKVIELMEATEGKLQLGSLGGRYVSLEAGEYLISLLHPQQDAAEIKAIKNRQARLEELPRPITPIAIPLEDGLTEADIHDRAARVAFDADGTGLSNRWTWLNDKAGWLVYDETGTGRIRSATQMFGNVTFMMFWRNGYEALATLDDDGDGVIAGGELRHLAIWRDINRNGVSDAGEVRSLASYDIQRLSCEAATTEAGVIFSLQGVTLTDGSTRPTFDVILQPNEGAGSLGTRR